jgi:diadenosine tetraphosphate (Ap4A) HIT family hydrolase
VEHAAIQNSGADCFLCDPDPAWVWRRTEHFFVMAALGPIVPGTSLIATRGHIGSMFDLDETLVPELDALTRAVKTRLGQVYDMPVHTTEHGRIGLCEVESEHDGHCYHAHRLVFPTDAPIAEGMSGSIISPIVAEDFRQARIVGGHLVQYLYYEAPDGTVQIGAEDSEAPRQFFRGIVADAVGQPELRSWRVHPQIELVDQAARDLR